jgi:hypothetical protein
LHFGTYKLKAAAQDPDGYDPEIRYRYCSVADVNPGPVVKYYSLIYQIARGDVVSTYKEDSERFSENVNSTYNAGHLYGPLCFTNFTEKAIRQDMDNALANDRVSGWKSVGTNWQR